MTKSKLNQNKNLKNTQFSVITLVIAIASLILAIVVNMANASNLDSKTIENITNNPQRHKNTTNNAKQIYTCHSALSMDSKPKHIAAKYIPYANPNAKKEGIFKTMALGGFDSLDLFVLKGNKADSLNLIYDSLMAQSLDEPFAIYPLIAKQICLASDGNSVRFRINEKARFNDKTPITAEDVKFSFDMLMQKGDPTYRIYYADIKEAIIIDKHTIEFSFKTNTNKELSFIISQLYIIPKHLYMGLNGENSFGKQPLRIPIGSGPYSIDRFEVNKFIIYKRNKNYWAKDLMINKGVYNFEQIRIEYYKDENVALRAFLAGNYDYRFERKAKSWANDYNVKSYKEGKFKKIELLHGLPAGMQGFYLNTRKTILKDKILREAIMQCFDFDWTNRYLFYSQYKRTKSYYENSEYASSGFLLDSKNKAEVKILKKLGILEDSLDSKSSITNNPNTKNQHFGLRIAKDYLDDIDSRMLTQSYQIPSTLHHSKRKNLKYAKKLLDDAGYKVIDNVLVNPNKKTVRLEILLNTPLFERVVLPFKKNLAILGIQLDISVVDSAQYENRVKKFDYDIIVGLIPQSLFPGNEQEYFFSSNSANLNGSRNFAGVKNKAIDKLIARLNKTQNHNERVAIIRAMDRILLWGFYVVPHYYSSSFNIAIKNNISMPHFPLYGSPYSAYYYWWIDK